MINEYIGILCMFYDDEISLFSLMIIICNIGNGFFTGEGVQK